MKGDPLYLRHILDAMARIESSISVGREVLMATTHWQDAVIRQLEIIGEATKRLSQELRSWHHLRSPSVAISPGLYDLVLADAADAR